MNSAFKYIGIFILFIWAPFAFSGGPQESREVVVTFDDLPFISTGSSDIAALREKTTRLLKTITAHKIPAIGFVNSSKLFPNHRRDNGQVELLRMWLEAGLELGNHTYSHKSLHKTPFPIFREDVIKGEKIVKQMVEKDGGKYRYFRHPYLHTGLTPEIKQTVESFLWDRGYTVAPVTIDNSDWIFSRAYDKAAGRGDRALMKRISDSFISYMDRKFQYYEKQSMELFGYQIKHVLLLHANTLNTDNLDRLARMLKNRGYTFVTLERALKDKAYRSPDSYTGRGGITWLHRWAITMGKKGAFFRGEPTTPAFVMKEAGVKSE